MIIIINILKIQHLIFLYYIILKLNIIFIIKYNYNTK